MLWKYEGYWTLSLTPFNANAVVYDLYSAIMMFLWQQLNVLNNHEKVPLKVSDGAEVDIHAVYAHVCRSIKAQMWLCQAVYRTLFPNTGCLTLCLLLQTKSAQKRSRSTDVDRSTFRPTTELKNPDKVLALPLSLSLSFLCLSRSTHPHLPVNGLLIFGSCRLSLPPIIPHYPQSPSTPKVQGFSRTNA